jgi:Family of unknown function (DUF6520)
MAMKFLKFLLPAAFLLLAISSLAAQTDLPNANDSACWTSLTALHNCVQAQQERAMAQAESCTSYPEYQCNPETLASVQQGQLQKQVAKHSNAAPAQAQPNASKNTLKSQGSVGGGSADQH